MVKRRTQRDRLKDYREEVLRARRWRKEQGYDALWAKLREMYQGQTMPANLDSTADWIAVNMAFSTINVMYPSISSGIPNITCMANDPSEEAQAVLVEEVLNWAWKHWDVQEPFRAAALDFLMFGHGWTKTTWKFVEEERPLTPDQQAEEFLLMREQVEVAAEENPSLLPELPSDDEIVANLASTALVVVEDRPVVEHISILDMYVNPEATTLGNARWVAQRVLRPLEDVQRDENYEPSRKDLKGMFTSYEDTDPRVDAMDVTGGHGRMVELWEFYDLVDGVMCVFTEEGSGSYLVKPGQMPYAFGHPYEMVRNYNVPDVFYPIGDLEQLYPLQQELNKTRSEMLNYRAAYARKYLARSRAFQRGDVEKLTSKTDGEVIFIEDDNIPLQDVVIPMPLNSLDPGLFNWSAQIISDVQEVSGVSEFARGGQQSVKRTATEAALIQDALNARQGEKLAQIEQFATKVARKLLQVMQQYMTGEQVARTFGPDGEQLWLPFDRESILGEFDFQVEAGSTQPNNETFRRQNAIALMQSLAPFVGSIIDPYELAKHILREGFSIRNPDKFMMQPDPMATQAVDEETGPLGSTPPDGQGVDAPQLTPEERREMEAQAETESIGGVPEQLYSQLSGQFGLS